MAKISINLATGSIQADDLIVGIDLGTTNSLIAIIHPDTRQPMALKDIDNSTLVPSVVHFGREGQIIVGQAAKPFLQTDAANTLYSVKRLMGKSYQDVAADTRRFSFSLANQQSDSLVHIQVGDRFYSPVELSSFILRELKHRAEHVLKTSVSKCVITVPAYFNDTQRQATRDAGKLAGLEVLRIINEPTAASLAYGIGRENDESKNMAVYDLGGGTFDITILKMSNGIFDVLSTNGDTALGGDDFDQLIASHFALQMHITDDILTEQKELGQSIRLMAEEAKKVLSNDDYFSASLGDHKLTISRAEFEILIEQLVGKTINCCAKALKDSGLDKKDIAGVVMVGGSTRVPLVKKAVSAFFETTLFDEVNPDEVVALGAAIQADILAGNNTEMLLLDVTPLSLGIETMGGLMDVLVPRNHKIPSQASRQYTTQKDGQTGIVISVYQGERDLVQDNRKLAEFTLKGIPAMPAGLPKVDIRFSINADGILQVKASELRSGVAQEIEVKPQYGLTDAEVENMLLASITHAREDIQTRSLIEASSEAQNMLDLTENFLRKHEQYITTEEKQSTTSAMMRLQEAIAQKDKERIIAGSEALNKISAPYAERVMDIAVAEALKGKGV